MNCMAQVPDELMIVPQNVSRDRKFYHEFLEIKEELFGYNKEELVVDVNRPNTETRKGLRVIAHRYVG